MRRRQTARAARRGHAPVRGARAHVRPRRELRVGHLLAGRPRRRGARPFLARPGRTPAHASRADGDEGLGA
eukprot:5535369-Prymnesium_polylepis.3